MSNLTFAICNHPSQARHPITDKPLVDGEGKPVPLFPKEKALTLEGEPGKPPQMIAYISEAGNLSFIRAGLSEYVRKQAESYVKENHGEVKTHVIAEPVTVEDETDEFEDDD